MSRPSGFFYAQNLISIMVHSFDVDEAIKYGERQAVIIYHLRFWIAKNIANGVNRYEVDEEKYPEIKGEYRTFTYNSIEAYQKLFPYMSLKAIRYALQKLEEKGVIITGFYSKNPSDRTKFYGFYDEQFTEGQMHLTKRANGFDNSGKCITDNKPVNINIKEKVLEDIKNSSYYPPVCTIIKEAYPLKEDDFFNLWWKHKGDPEGFNDTRHVFNSIRSFSLKEMPKLLKRQKAQKEPTVTNFNSMEQY